MDQAAILRTFNRLRQEGKAGFTIDAQGNESKPDTGYAVGVKSYNSYEDALNDLKDHQCLGWWVDSAGEKCIDIVELFQAKATALLAAYTRGQVSVYDFGSDEVIDCSSFYKEN